MVLAASDFPGWGINDGNVSAMVFDIDVNHASFSHTRVFNITPGSHDFYAVAENYVDLGGSGMGSIYASLTVEFIPDIITDVEKSQGIILDYSLEQNYPNPFNPTTKIKYQIPELSFVTLKVFDVLGNEITTLVNKERPGGSYDIEFNATGLPSGIYFYQLQAGHFVTIKKMVLMK
ncbi:MAG: T9SS type A sorting domain-containing protein [Ignavibacteria bacterium]|nr:T9SS type A sorting domain-containing protein [Ignavibacteria bacterium]MBT8382611.1 T9SS type A sorting domain-containing protein [Ignavibacteria bacterium]MBT8392888.1 T9SS type A sorting domain-containing protein [Ignavibacteria bacterium]NNJ52695.1 T9SS type A sorting domain-containing protein [Ignavibacteriaceae bacterium]NNL21552.1 T9SS type A sorting domain-containing protein [Ignavibacteriaceae bacterium]